MSLEVILETLYQTDVVNRDAVFERIHAHYARMNLKKRGARIATTTTNGWHGESGGAKSGGHITVDFWEEDGVTHVTRHHVYPTDEGYRDGKDKRGKDVDRRDVHSHRLLSNTIHKTVRRYHPLLCLNTESLQVFAIGLTYQVVSRRLPTENELNPKIYRMRIFAPNEVVVKSQFWVFLAVCRICHFPGSPHEAGGREC
ncbi:hypothetical protein BJV77DRAFT_966706 [Russula vinacea]|nr:hypothetical protein BJV77DRAFT_966706 [Russula vinacea]